MIATSLTASYSYLRVCAELFMFAVLVFVCGEVVVSMLSFMFFLVDVLVR